MSEQLVKVKLYGYLRKFGKEFELAVKSPAEAVRALCIMVPGFKAFLQNAEHRGITFAVFNGKRNITKEELTLGAKPEIRIATVIAGRKSGLLQTIVGIVLIVVGVVFEQPWMIKMGAALVIGGILQMMSPQPSLLEKGEDADNRSSYAFGGPVNTTAQGNPIGILYGEREIGGAVISAGIFAENLT
jgi:predicted phage tail protein